MVVHPPRARRAGAGSHLRQLGAGHDVVPILPDSPAAGFSGAARADLAAAVAGSFFLRRRGSHGGVASARRARGAE